VVDATGKLPGRGAYLHPYQQCWKVVLRGGRIDQALRTKLNEEDRRALLAYMATLPESEAVDTEATDTEVAGAATTTEGAA
jgi:predicted RNA-binding protein YlxR (DUF448 family)